MNDLHFPEYAKDIKLNLHSLLDGRAQDGLSEGQIALIALAAAYSIGNQPLIEAIRHYASEHGVGNEGETAAKTAATIMAMNNVYYRFTHLLSDKDYLQMPAKLRMNAINNPGVAKVDFELMSMAVSAINGCGLCMDAHAKSLQKLDVDKAGIQTTVRIAAVIAAAATALNI